MLSEKYQAFLNNIEIYFRCIQIVDSPVKDDQFLKKS